jgi:hypothetical protein
MNNYHLFLIRSDSVTQIAAHLAAGVIALVFLASLAKAPATNLPDAPASREVTAIVLPAGTPMLAAVK